MLAKLSGTPVGRERVVVRLGMMSVPTESVGNSMEIVGEVMLSSSCDNSTELIEGVVKAKLGDVSEAVRSVDETSGRIVTLPTLVSGFDTESTFSIGSVMDGIVVSRLVLKPSAGCDGDGDWTVRPNPVSIGGLERGRSVEIPGNVVSEGAEVGKVSDGIETDGVS